MCRSRGELVDREMAVQELPYFHRLAMRDFFPWTPIEVSPIGIAAFLSKRGWFVLKGELLGRK